MVRRPVVSSMRSRQTGQVGSSTREGVGGGRGFRASGEAAESAGKVDWVGVNGSRDMSGKEAVVSVWFEEGRVS